MLEAQGDSVIRDLIALSLVGVFFGFGTLYLGLLNGAINCPAGGCSASQELGTLLVTEVIPIMIIIVSAIVLAFSLREITITQVPHASGQKSTP